MKKFFAVLAIALTSQAVLAADIYVREARGAGLSSSETSQITESVKNAVRGMADHNLVFSEGNADYVLQPSLIKKGSQNVLRLQALQGSEVIATNEQTISPRGGSQQYSVAARSTLSQVPSDTQAPGAQASGEEVTESTTDSTLADIGSRSANTSPDGTGSVSGSTSSGNVSPNGAAAGGEHQDSLSGGTSSSTGSSGSVGSMGSMGRSSGSTGSRSQGTTTTDTTAQDSSTMGGETRGMASQMGPGAGNRMGYFSLGAGPSVAIGLNSDNVMYGLSGAYNVDFNERFGGKVLGNLNLGTGSDTSRFIDVGVGANIYFPEAAIARGRPYLTGDIGWGNARRNDTDDVADSLAVGVGGGFQFAAQNLNLDLLLRYAILTNQIRDNTPSVLGIQLAVNF